MIESKRNIEESNEDENGSGDENDVQKEYNKLKNEKNEKEKEIQRLEKEYLKKISELLIMIQVHCEIKDEMYKNFKKSGAINDDKK